ncbi:MAG: hypothetical protein ACE5ER_00135 [Nitrospinaceae bacterium]
MRDPAPIPAMDDFQTKLQEEILHLYQEPVICSGYGNTYGEENLVNLVNKYRALDEAGMRIMLAMVVSFSTSTDLSTSFVSVGVMHALNQDQAVEAAYQWARTQPEGAAIVNHFDIGCALADHFISA